MRHLFLLGLILSAPLAVGQSTPPAATDSEGFEAIRPAMQQYVDDGVMSGVVTLVAHRGELVHLEAVGFQDREAGTPMPTDALFRIASMTKPLVSVIAMMLVEEGQLALEDPIADYLPEMADVQVFVGTEPDGSMRLETPARPVTVQDVMTHTAGFASGGFGSSPVNARYREANPVGASMSLAEEVNVLAQLPLQHHPGEAWTYGLSTDVLGRLVEVVSGQPLRTVLRERLIEPLGMTNTDYWVRESELDRLTTLYAHGENGELRRLGDPADSRFASPSTFNRGTSGLVSTAQDYVRFAQMLLHHGTFEGVQYLRPETVERMRVNQLRAEQLPMRVGSFSFPGPGWGFGLGLGVVIDSEATRLPFPEGTLWWPGSTDTYFWVDSENELVGILMTQLADLEMHAFYPEFAHLVYAALPKGVSEEQTP